MPFSYIVGDIGGTNARLHLYKVPETGDEELVAKSEYKSQLFASLSNLINKFLMDEGIEEMPNSACFSIAGPVKNGMVSMTNLGWTLSEEEMESELKIPSITFLNDFAACGYGIELLQSDELYEISDNKQPIKDGPKVIIGAGTGLGEAFIIEKEKEFIVVPGEGGHTDFSPRNKIEFDLMLFIRNKLNLSRVGVERVVSGPGLENIYWFFVSNDPKLENPDISTKIRSAKHPGRYISKFAIEKEDVLCEKALKLFISCYGAEAGNAALHVLPSGGVYITGGIAPQLRDVIKEEFLNSFYHKGRMRQLLSSYPIYIVMNLSIGILGARYIARTKINDSNHKISRDLSFGDIKSMSSQVGLLSEEPKDYIIDKNKPRPERFALKSHKMGAKKGHATCSKKSSMHNFLWMGAGIGISALLLAAFMLGKGTKDE